MGFAMILMALGGIGWVVIAAVAWLVTLPIRILLEPREITTEEAYRMMMEDTDKLINDVRSGK